MRPAAALANLGWAASALPAWRAFRRALEEPRRAQEAVLARILRANASTDFGRRHGLARASSARDFQRRVPVRSYDELRADIDRVARGERGVLTAEPVTRLAWSSGSTAAAKLLPQTRALGREYRRALGPWIVELLRERPSLGLGPAYWSVSPLEPRTPPADCTLPVGLDEDASYLGGLLAPMIGAALAVPERLRHERDARTFRRLTLLHLLRARELRLVSVWHPSFLALLLDALVDEWDELLDTLERGVDEPELRARWPRLARGDARRARELAQVDPRAVRHIWPRLGLVSAWAHGPARRPAAELSRRLGGVPLQPKGLLATEAFVTLPFGGGHPPALRSHFLELEEEPGGRARLVHELEPGGEYGVIVTTSGGLYRYRLGDRVRVVGRVGRAPSLEFVERADAVSDLRGEKLSEGFVAHVLEQLLAERAGFALLAADEGGSPPGYVLLAELAPAEAAPLAPRLDALLAANPHYALCRRLGQLAPARMVTVERGARRFFDEQRRRGLRVGDAKPTALARGSGWVEALSALPVPRPPESARDQNAKPRKIAGWK